MFKRIQKAIEEKEEGFTLIELLVVMIIIGILAAIAIPIFLSQKQKAYETSLKADLSSIATNIATAEVDSPTSIDLPAAAATGTITFTGHYGATATEDFDVVLSPNNSVDTTTAWTTAGTYCVALENSGAVGHIWHVSVTAGAQAIEPGAC